MIAKKPKEYASLPLEEMEDIAQDYVNKLESSINPKTGESYSPGYLSNCLDAIRSWADWNRKPLQRTIKITNANSTPTLEDERAPTQEELRRVLYGDKSPLRTRASIALIAFAGMRPEVQGNYLGLDGLKVRDLPEMEVTGKEIKFNKIPTTIIVRAEISKIRKQYMTFLNEEGCEILKQYLERRMLEEGETLGPSSGIIVASNSPEGRQENFGIKDRSPFLRTPKISEAIREAMRASGLPWRPYVWRVYFDTAMLVAEGKGLISHAYQQFIMGHSGDIERTYTLSKHRLPEEVTEDIRRATKRCAQFLETRRPKDTDLQMLKMVREGLLLAKQFTPDAINKLDIEGMSNEEFLNLLKMPKNGTASSSAHIEQPNDGSTIRPDLIVNGAGPGRHAAIPLGQLEQFLVNGCRYVDKYTT
ncbi:MAG: hypothetical protein ACRDF4_04880, partial [Rhabdochlamydiaceae bacterium]